jgi:hypothetical protein
MQYVTACVLLFCCRLHVSGPLVVLLVLLWPTVIAHWSLAAALVVSRLVIHELLQSA